MPLNGHPSIQAPSNAAVIAAPSAVNSPLPNGHASPVAVVPPPVPAVEEPSIPVLPVGPSEDLLLAESRLVEIDALRADRVRLETSLDLLRQQVRAFPPGLCPILASAEVHAAL